MTFKTLFYSVSLSTSYYVDFINAHTYIYRGLTTSFWADFFGLSINDENLEARKTFL
jgi:hypothetical protein